MPEFALIAEDGCVATDVLAFIAAAVNLQMQRDVAPVWAQVVWTVVALDSLAGVKPTETRKILTFKKKLGVAGALGFHTEASGIDFAEALPPAAGPAGEAIDGTTRRAAAWRASWPTRSRPTRIRSRCASGPRRAR